jgi:hypothetical protein
MRAPMTGSWPPWTVPEIAEPGTVVGLVVVVVVVTVESCFSWNAPQPLSRAEATRENARQRLNDRGKGESPENCK